MKLETSHSMKVKYFYFSKNQRPKGRMSEQDSFNATKWMGMSLNLDVNPDLQPSISSRHTLVAIKMTQNPKRGDG